MRFVLSLNTFSFFVFRKLYIMYIYWRMYHNRDTYYIMLYHVFRKRIGTTCACSRGYYLPRWLQRCTLSSVDTFIRRIVWHLISKYSVLNTKRIHVMIIIIKRIHVMRYVIVFNWKLHYSKLRSRQNVALLIIRGIL